MTKIGLFLNMRPEGGGAFQYSQSILEALVKLDYEIIVYYTDIRWRPHLQELSIKSHYLAYRKRTFWIQLLYRKLGLPVFVFRKFVYKLFTEYRTLLDAEVDLFIFPGQDPESYLLDLKAISTVHDLMHIYEPKYSELSSTRIRNYHYNNMLKYCDAVMVDSELGKIHVLDNYDVNSDKIKVVPFIAPHYIRHHKVTDIKKPLITGDYIFYPAQFWTHKNHLSVLKAFTRLENCNFKLVFSGARKNGYDDVKNFIEKYSLSKKVDILGYVSDDDMLNLYYHSIGVIFASVCGPTNIPPIEAIMMKKPLLCSNKYGMPEQCGEAALYFDPLNIEEISSLMKMISSRNDVRQRLVREAEVMSESFDVDALVQNVNQVIKFVK